MFKRLNAYLTLESSYIFSMIITLYYLIIMLAFFLFARCVSSQNLFFDSLRTARFTYAGDTYNEVIYGDMESLSLDNSRSDAISEVRGIRPIEMLRSGD